jgi:hypothetical protein
MSDTPLIQQIDEYKMQGGKAVKTGKQLKVVKPMGMEYASHEPNAARPVQGMQLQEVEGWSKFNYFSSPLVLNQFLRNHLSEANPFHSEYRVTSQPWMGVPKKMRSKKLTYEDLYNQFIAYPSKASDKVKQAVFDAMPKAVKDVLVDSERWSDIKGELNLDRIFAGKRKFMKEQIQQEKPTKVIGIGVQMNALGDIQEEVLSMRGVVAALAVECLEKLGYSVELIGYTHSGNCYSFGANTNTFACRIKAAGEKMATSALMNLTSAWFFRSAVFATNNHASRNHVRAGQNGQGSSRTMSDADVKMFEQMCPTITDFAILRYVPRTNGFIGELEKAVDAMLDCLDPYL